MRDLVKRLWSQTAYTGSTTKLEAAYRIEELETENQRLREALGKCADPHRYHAPCPHCCQTITECGSYIARATLAALAKTSPPEGEE